MHLRLSLSQTYRGGQKLLERQRYQFPTSWLYVDNIEGEWGAYNEIMKRKDAAIQQQVASLQMKIVSEDRAVEARTTELLAEWEKGKPVEVCYASLLLFTLHGSDCAIFCLYPTSKDRCSRAML